MGRIWCVCVCYFLDTNGVFVFDGNRGKYWGLAIVGGSKYA